ncbi:MAG: ComEC/Rec2 family competence protein [Patescibacteria group bacterium]|nr:ComEC/Rec2 family competence protein [Patescibacteria group bacterium]
MEIKTKKYLKIIGGLAAIIFLLIGFVASSEWQRQNLEIDYLNVGQGDSILIKTPFEQNILIDGGPDNTVLAELGTNLAFFDKDIDLVILTHPHSDHVTGLVEILRRYNVKKILMTGVAYSAAYYQTFLAEIKNKNIPVEIIGGQKDIVLGPQLDIQILFPFSNLSDQNFDDVNDSSIVAKLIYKSDSFLFEGDAGKVVEDDLILNKIDLAADVLKVGHHGSKYATSPEFLDAVKPDMAIISVGKNNYGHPDPGVIERLGQALIKIFRTDLAGTIKIISDGNQIQIKNQG